MSDIISALGTPTAANVLEKLAAAISSKAASVGRHVERPGILGGAPSAPAPNGEAAEWRPQGDIDLSSLLLSDMSLSRLSPPIAELGYVLAPSEVSGVTGMPSRVHVATGAGQQVYLVNLPHQVMSLLTPDSAARVYALATAFPSRARVRLISENCTRSNGGWFRVWKEWLRQGLDAVYFEWGEIVKLDDLKPAERTEFVIETFKISPVRGAFSTAPDFANLRADEAARRLIVAQFSERGPKSGLDPLEYVKRRASAGNLPWLAELGTSYTRYDDAATGFLDWLLLHETLPGRAGWSALGAVLHEMLLEFGDEDRAAVFDIIVRYRLIPPAAIAAMEARLKQ